MQDFMQISVKETWSPVWNDQPKGTWGLGWAHKPQVKIREKRKWDEHGFLTKREKFQASAISAISYLHVFL